MISKLKILIGIVLVLIVGNFFVHSLVLAADETVLTGSGTDCNCATTKYTAANPGCQQYCGTYEVSDFVRLAVRVSQIILGVTGSIALLAFIYGGVLFLISAGSSEMVTKGRQTMIAAVIGLIIVFASYAIIGFVFSTLGIGNAWNTSGWMDNNSYLYNNYVPAP